MDRLTAKERSENMRRVRAKDTVPEMLVRRLVHGMGFRYRLHVTALPGKPDLVFPRMSKIIEVRGCFWHQHKCCKAHIPKSRTEFWRSKLNGNKRRDKQNERQLLALGWAVCAVWECELKNLDEVKRRLAQFLSA